MLDDFRIENRIKLIPIVDSVLQLDKARIGNQVLTLQDLAQLREQIGEPGPDDDPAIKRAKCIVRHLLSLFRPPFLGFSYENQILQPGIFRSEERSGGKEGVSESR